MNPTVQELNKKREEAVDSGQNPYTGNLSNINTFSGGTITPEMMMRNVKPAVVAEKTPITGNIGLGGAVEAVANDFKTSNEEAQRLGAENAKINAEKISTEDSKRSLMDKILGRKTETSIKDQEYTSTVDPARVELNDINNQILQEQQSMRRQIEGLNGIGLTDVQRAQKEQEIRRLSTSKQADLAVIQLARQNKYELAKDIADRKVAAQLEQDRQNIDLLKFDYEQNKELFNKDETRQYNEMIKKKDREYETKKVDLKTISDLSLEALRGGAPASIAADMRSQAKPEDAMRIGGQYIGSLDRQKTMLEIAKLKNEVDAGAPITGEWASVVNGAAGLVASTKQKTVKMNIASALSSGNYSNAYAEVANAVSDGLTGTNKTKFDDARTDIGVMQGMRTAIKAYVDAGGNVGYLRGTADQIAKKFGQLAYDPKFAALGVQLVREFQAYRNNMTGAAFSPAESKEYASVNPRTNASLDLNLATIDGAISQLSNRVTSTVNARVPDADKIWNKMNNSNATKTVTSNGREYVVGQIYQDASGSKWVVDSSGKWSKQ